MSRISRIGSTTTEIERDAKCKDCGLVFHQSGSVGCFGGHIRPHDCPDCGSERMEIALSGFLSDMLVLGLPETDGGEVRAPALNLEEFTARVIGANPSDEDLFSKIVTAALHGKIATLKDLSEFAKVPRWEVKLWKIEGAGRARLLPGATMRSMIYDELRKRAEAKCKGYAPNE